MRLLPGAEQALKEIGIRSANCLSRRDPENRFKRRVPFYHDAIFINQKDPVGGLLDKRMKRLFTPGEVLLSQFSFGNIDYGTFSNVLSGLILAENRA